MSFKKKVLVIGDGIMAWNVLFQLKDLDLDIYQYYQNDLFPACSDSSTAINCLRGTTRGVSVLGDMIVDAFDAFESFLEKHRPDGVNQGFEYQIFDHTEKWSGRYPDYENVNKSSISTYVKKMNYYHKNKAYFFDLKKLRSWYLEKNSHVIKKMAFVSAISADGVVSSSLGDEHFDLVIVCSNYNTSLCRGLNESVDYYLDHCKAVAGSYLETDYDCSEFSNSINLAFEKYHLIFRKEENKLQIGATTDNRTSHHLPNEKGLEEIYHFISSNTKLSLPAIEHFLRRVGVRLKGYKRLPCCDFVTPNVYMCSGLYKNGYVLPYLFSLKIKDLLC